METSPAAQVDNVGDYIRSQGGVELQSGAKAEVGSSLILLTRGAHERRFQLSSFGEAHRVSLWCAVAHGVQTRVTQA